MLVDAEKRRANWQAAKTLNRDWAPEARRTVHLVWNLNEALCVMGLDTAQDSVG